MTYQFTHKRTLLAAAMAFTCLSAGQVNAADLKENIAVEGRTVTIGDLFTDAGDKANISVLEAPDPGKAKYVSAASLERIAKKYELDWARPDYLKRISLSRHSDTLPMSDLADLLLELAITNGANEDSQVRLLGRNDGLTVPVGTLLADVEVTSFTLSDRKDRFSAVFSVPSGGDVPTRLSLSGTVEEVRDIPVFNRSVMPGEVIQQSDISWIKYPAKRLSARAIINTTSVVGMTVRRPTRTDKPINASNILAPVVVAKGEAVTMMVRTRAMVLTAAGRALENGGIGDTIRVLNPKSSQTIDAKIVRAGQVEVLAGPTLALGSR